MKEFRNYRPDNKSSDTVHNETGNTQQLQDSINKYSSMNQQQLMDQLMQSVAIQKSNGTYDKDKIDQFIAMASSVLSPEQVLRMRQLLDKLD